MATFLRSRAVVQLVGQSTPSLITSYWDSAGAAIGLLATEAVARDRAFWAALTGVLANGTIYTPNLIVDEIEETTGALVNQIGASAPAALSFAAAGEPLPFAVQALVKFGTNAFIGGRRVQGRRFVPGARETDSAGTPPVPQTALTNALINANAALGTTVVTPIGQRVWHRPKNGAGGLSVPVISRSVSGTFAILKSRRT